MVNPQNSKEICKSFMDITPYMSIKKEKIDKKKLIKKIEKKGKKNQHHTLVFLHQLPWHQHVINQDEKNNTTEWILTFMKVIHQYKSTVLIGYPFISYLQM